VVGSFLGYALDLGMECGNRSPAEPPTASRIEANGRLLFAAGVIEQRRGLLRLSAEQRRGRCIIRRRRESCSASAVATHRPVG